MRLKDRLLKRKQDLDKETANLRIESEQKRAEKIRNRKKLAEPGTIIYGLLYQQHPFDVMKDAVNRRRQRRVERRAKQDGND